jgi:hypothetical protein
VFLEIGSKKIPFAATKKGSLTKWYENIVTLSLIKISVLWGSSNYTQRPGLAAVLGIYAISAYNQSLILLLLLKLGTNAN